MKHSTIAFFLTLLLLVYAAINYYLLKRTSQALDVTGVVRLVVVWCLVVLALLYPVGRIAERFLYSGVSNNLARVGSFYLGIMFYGVLLAVFIDLAGLANRFLGFVHLTGSMGRNIWLAAACIIIATVVAGHLVAVHPRLRTMELYVAKNAAGLSTLSIVLVTDMHLGTEVGIAQLKRIMTLIKASGPDLVLLAGDIFDMDVSDEMEREIALILSGIKTRYGVFAVTGNHEYYGGLEKAVANLTKGNVTVLQDTVALIGNAFYLIGRRDLTAERMDGGRKTLGEICTGLDRALPLILMDHQPFHLEEAMKCGIDLQVSGHTHNAQLFPLNLFYGLIYEKAYGYLKKGNTNIVVSCGAGTWGPPVRTTSIPEVVLIRLHFGKRP